jgi:NitT/TauT family transport system ATP-binding protein
VVRPKLLLMDEPFAALDEITRLRLNDDLAGLAKDLGTTVVFVTHSVTESIFLSDRVVVMTPRPGRVIATLTVAAPRKRTEEFSLSPEYVETCRRASAVLREAMQDVDDF